MGDRANAARAFPGELKPTQLPLPFNQSNVSGYTSGDFIVTASKPEVTVRDRCSR